MPASRRARAPAWGSPTSARASPRCSRDAARGCCSRREPGSGVVATIGAAATGTLAARHDRHRSRRGPAMKGKKSALAVHRPPTAVCARGGVGRWSRPFAVAIALAAAWGSANRRLPDPTTRELPRFVLLNAREPAAALLLVPLLMIADALCAGAADASHPGGRGDRRGGQRRGAVPGSRRSRDGAMRLRWTAGHQGCRSPTCCRQPHHLRLHHRRLPLSPARCSMHGAGACGRARPRAPHARDAGGAPRRAGRASSRSFSSTRCATRQRCGCGTTRSATQLIDDLIAYLRAALPHLAATRSTGRQRSAGSSRRGSRCSACAIWPAAVRARGRRRRARRHLPPMVLLPLVDVAAARAARGGATPRPLAMRARHRGRPAVRHAARRGDVFRRGRGRAPVIATVRERLRAVHGRAAHRPRRDRHRQLARARAAPSEGCRHHPAPER